MKGGKDWYGMKGGKDWYGPSWGAKKWGSSPTSLAATEVASIAWVTIPAGSSIVQQGMQPEAPAAVYDKNISAFSCSANILAEIVGDISTEVTITHDADWEHFPEVGAAVKEAAGIEDCFAIASAPSFGTWAIGVASGWKGRESAAKLSLSLALAAQNMPCMTSLSYSYPDFGLICRHQGFMSDGKGGGKGFGSKSSVGKQAAQPLAENAEVPPLHFVAVPADSKLVAAGLPAEAPVVGWSKHLKDFFCNAHSILAEMIEDVAAEVTFEDDPDWKVMPEVGEAIKTAGAEETCYCVARSEAHACWGVGLASGWKGRESAAKLALAVAAAQNAGKIEEFSKSYPEFGIFLGAAGIIEPPQKKRKMGGW